MPCAHATPAALRAATFAIIIAKIVLDFVGH
jgi:hypothetical protein